MKLAYSAINQNKKEVTGEVEARDKDEAAKILTQAGYNVLSIDEAFSANKFLSASFFDKASLKDIVNTSRQMAALLEAGVPVVKGFQLLEEDTTKPFLKNSYQNIIQNIKAGVSISSSLAKHPKIFDDFYVNMIRSGEESGKLGNSFSYLADYLDRSYALTQKVKNAMIYPGFVVGTFVIVMVLVFTTVIPKLSGILTESGVELPVITQAVLGISNFLVNYGVYMLIVIVGLGGYIYISIRDTNAFQEFSDTVKIKLPVLKNIFKMLYVTRIADNIQTLLGSGVSLTKCLQISADVVGNIHYKRILEKALVDVRGGMPFSQSISGNKDLIPSSMIQMVKIGEETGEIGKLMGNIAKFYQREITGAVDTMVSLIEPAMIVLLGLGVGLLLVSVLLPIYNLAGAF